MSQSMNKHVLILRIYSYSLLILSLAVLLYIVSLPADPKNAWLLGLSKARWGMLAGAALLFCVTLLLAVSGLRKPDLLRRISTRLSLWLARPWTAWFTLAAALVVVLAGVWFLRFWTVHGGDQFLMAYITRFAPFVLFFTLTGIEILLLLPFYRKEMKPHYLAFGWAVFCVGVVYLLTNHVPVEGMPWDVKYYYLLAERGLEGQNIAPYVYRYATPFLARRLAEIFYLPTYGGYTVLALSGGVLQLFGVYWLARAIRAGLKAALLAMLATALAMFNLKFMLFDISRPDHLAYLLMVMAVLALFSDRVVLCTLISAIGLQFREHLAIPPFIAGVQSLMLWWRNKKQFRPLLQAGFIALVIGLAVLLPRLLIPVVDNTQFVDLQKPASLINLIGLPLDFWRDTNFLFCTLAYILPVLLLLTRARAHRLWEMMRPYRFFLMLYSAIVLLLSLYGGHDMTRYSTYLFLPQAMAIAMLAEDDIPAWEWIYMVIAVALFNRIFFHIPIPLDETDRYLDFYGGYANRVNISSLYRWGELSLYSLGVVSLRWLTARRGAKQDGRARS